MTGWTAIDDLITSEFNRHPQNTDTFLVLLKLRLVNRLYNTNIKAEYQVAQNIVERETELSRLLLEGDANAVQMIAECGIERKEQVFASKFAHFHQPQQFAIGDKYVDVALRALGLKPWNPFSHRDDVAQGYEHFRKKIQSVARHLSISLKEADHYLWLKGQKELGAIEGTDELGAEVQTSMESYPQLWAEL